MQPALCLAGIVMFEKCKESTTVTNPSIGFCLEKFPPRMIGLWTCSPVVSITIDQMISSLIFQ